jgi:hypothetical protein
MKNESNISNVRLEEFFIIIIKYTTPDYGCPIQNLIKLLNFTMYKLLGEFVTLKKMDWIMNAVQYGYIFNWG